jgi:hypothetical protein
MKYKWETPTQTPAGLKELLGSQPCSQILDLAGSQWQCCDVATITTVFYSTGSCLKLSCVSLNSKIESGPLHPQPLPPKN